mmetsp:Transcript_8598/g.18275  ORF Transcript_8598/g.18275 Transcript_8598/m.18275 type:complete len:219 (+) Transcript_8598:957-1613(+)
MHRTSPLCMGFTPYEGSSRPHDRARYITADTGSRGAAGCHPLLQLPSPHKAWKSVRKVRSLSSTRPLMPSITRFTSSWCVPVPVTVAVKMMSSSSPPLQNSSSLYSPVTLLSYPASCPSTSRVIRKSNRGSLRLPFRVVMQASPATSLTFVTVTLPFSAGKSALRPGSSSDSRCLVHSSFEVSSQCHEFTFFPSFLCSTTHLGSPSPHFAMTLILRNL